MLRRFGHLVDRHAPGQQPGPIGPFHGVRLFLVGVRLEGAGNSVQQIGRRDDTLEMSILIVHERDGDSRGAKDVQNIKRLQRVGDDPGRRG